MTYYVSGFLARQIVNTSATQLREKLFEHLEGSRPVRTPLDYIISLVYNGIYRVDKLLDISKLARIIKKVLTLTLW